MSAVKTERRNTNDGKSLRQLVSDLTAKKYRNVVFLVGAGISTAAGIPDFRSPKTGLYANLQRFNLPYPEAVFDIDYLVKHPEPFFMLAREMAPSQFKPTRFHDFIKWVSELGILRRVYTQNIDTLERRAGIPSSLIVEAHGSFSGNHCVKCKLEIIDDEENRRIEKIVHSGNIPRCRDCDGIVKPNIVFFGEGLPSRFFEMIEEDFENDPQVDLVIVAGTSLQVSPFNQLPDMVGRHVPRYLFNLERVGTIGKRRKDVLVLDRLQNFEFEFVQKQHEGDLSPASSSEAKKESSSHRYSEFTNESKYKNKHSEEPAKPTNEDVAGIEQVVANLNKLNI